MKKKNYKKKFIILNKQFSTTRCLVKVLPGEIRKKLNEPKRPKDEFETVLFMPKCTKRKYEGGLRKKGYFKSKNKKKPLITVITIVLNNYQKLEETILSVINQSYSNIEYIIIDGGSNKKTLNVIRKYDSVVDYWISEKDDGIYDAMNKGCKLALGNGLLFLNSGDKFVGDVINNSTKLPYLLTCKVREENNFIYKRKISSLKNGMPTSHQAMVFKNQKKLYDLTYKISSDYDFYIRNGSFLKLNRNSKGYVLYDNTGLSKTNRLIRDLENIKIIFKNFGINEVLKFLIKKIFNFLI